MIELLLKLEMSLWINETRGNFTYMNQVLHPEFLEYGKSGRVYNKEEILKDMDVQINSVFPFPNLNVKQVDDNTYLVTYQSVLQNGATREICNRSSIWISNGEKLQIIHHQGTLTK